MPQISPVAWLSSDTSIMSSRALLIVYDTCIINKRVGFGGEGQSSTTVYCARRPLDKRGNRLAGRAMEVAPQLAYELL